MCVQTLFPLFSPPAVAICLSTSRGFAPNPSEPNADLEPLPPAKLFSITWRRTRPLSKPFLTLSVAVSLLMILLLLILSHRCVFRWSFCGYRPFFPFCPSIQVCFIDVIELRLCWFLAVMEPIFLLLFFHQTFSSANSYTSLRQINPSCILEKSLFLKRRPWILISNCLMRDISWFGRKKKVPSGV